MFSFFRWLLIPHPKWANIPLNNPKKISSPLNDPFLYSNTPCDTLHLDEEYQWLVAKKTSLKILPVLHENLIQKGNTDKPTRLRSRNKVVAPRAGEQVATWIVLAHRGWSGGFLAHRGHQPCREWRVISVFFNLYLCPQGSIFITAKNPLWLSTLWKNPLWKNTLWEKKKTLEKYTLG